VKAGGDWRTDDIEDGGLVNDRQPVLVSFHYLRSTLRRRWPVWGAFGAVGMLVAALLFVVVPAGSSGTVTLFLAHDTGQDPAVAMSTDVGILTTRAVSAGTVERLGIEMTSEDFQRSFIATPTTSSVLVVTVSAPDDTAAVERTEALASEFLEFRSEQLRMQADAQISGYQREVDDLNAEVTQLTKRYDVLSADGQQEQAAAALTQRSQLNEQINSLQRTIEDISLRVTAVVEASTVLDEPSVVPHSAKRRMVLVMASGLIGGLAVGMGLVAFQAVTSDRVRRRREVALAVGAPVQVSVGPIRKSRWLFWVPMRLWSSSPERGLNAVVTGVSASLRGSRRSVVRMALGAVENTEEAAAILGALAARMNDRGEPVVLVDLSERGCLAGAVTKAFDQGGGSRLSAVPMVLRPSIVPFFGTGPVGSDPSNPDLLPEGDARRRAFETAAAVLVLVDLDPGIGVEHVKPWAQNVVVVVTAGRSSAERLRTTGELVRTAELDLRFVVLLGADRGDESLGALDEHRTDTADDAEARATSP
jgi:capsular polysaccharide biosynthesis protein